MNVSTFLKSYDADFCWLDYALRSIDKFATGFTETILAIPEGQSFHRDGLRTVYIREPADCDHYLFQQITKLYSDALTDADYILFTDSDTIFTRPVTPETYFTDGRINWLITPYVKTDTPWQPMIEKFLRRPVEFEAMRRHPTIVPRWLLIAMREFCEKQHGMPLDKYVMSQPYRAFSEFNALGAFAYYFHHDKFNWINTEEVPEEQWPPLTVLQKYSHGGLTPEIEAQFERILSPASALVCSAPNGTTESLAAHAPTLLFKHIATSLQDQQIPWQDKDSSLAEISRLSSRLKEFCGKASHVRAVRLELHKLGVIELPYRFKRRKGKWRSKKK